MISRRFFLAALPPLALGSPAHDDDWPTRLVAAARRQVGHTTGYDPAYVKLAYPGGDVPQDRGVCTDVVIRAYRRAFGVDLQRLVHEDMVRHFSAYPAKWSLTQPDASIDHRRVPNLETFLNRRGAARPLGESWLAGDLITQRLPAGQPHVVIVTGDRSLFGQPLVVHNIGAGVRVEAIPAFARNVGRFRFAPDRA